MALSLFIDAPAALADSPHAYSVASINVNGVQGIEGQWTNQNMRFDSNDYSSNAHLTAEEWIQTMSSDSWIETGLLNSANIWGKNPLQLYCLSQFWADASYFNETGHFYFHWIDNTTPDGTNHVYEILSRYNGSNLWDIYLDYQYIGTSTIETVQTGFNPEYGLESYDGDVDTVPDFANSSTSGRLDPDEFANTFNSYDQVETNGTWWYPSWSTFITTFPCGSYANGYCTNGANYGAGKWSYNMPG